MVFSKITGGELDPMTALSGFSATPSCSLRSTMP
jgi:hypothetical protein